VIVAESAGLLQPYVADAQTLRLLDALDATQYKHGKHVMHSSPKTGPP